MGKFTIERWRCDRCHREADRWRKAGTAYEVIVSVDFGTAGGRDIEWKELCLPCNEAVGKEIAAMKDSAITARLAVSSGDPQ